MELHTAFFEKTNNKKEIIILTICKIKTGKCYAEHNGWLCIKAILLSDDNYRVMCLDMDVFFCKQI